MHYAQGNFECPVMSTMIIATGPHTAEIVPSVYDGPHALHLPASKRLYPKKDMHIKDLLVFAAKVLCTIWVQPVLVVPKKSLPTLSLVFS